MDAVHEPWHGLHLVVCLPGAPLQNILLLTGLVPRQLNFLPIFYGSLCVDELFFLVGMWLLMKRYVASVPARLFAILAASGSLISIEQPWYNLHLFGFIPLIVHLVHTAIDKTSRWALVIALNLVFFQSLGSLPYFLPIVTFTVFLYFCWHFAAVPEDLSGLGRLFTKGGLVLSILFGLAILIDLAMSMVPAYYVVNLGTKDIVNYNLQRSLEGKVSLGTFLNYGGQIRFGKWLELLLGVSLHLDNTLYFGVTCLPFVLLGVWGRPRSTLALSGTALVLGLVSTGLFPAALVYYWPFMNYFRHIGLISASIKLFLIILAGCGIEYAVFSEPRRRAAILGCAVFFALWPGRCSLPAIMLLLPDL